VHRCTGGARHTAITQAHFEEMEEVAEEMTTIAEEMGEEMAQTLCVHSV
jgi:hypothetical protein